SSPLLEDVSVAGASGVLLNITGGRDLTLHEVNEASSVVIEAAGEDANVIFGAVIDPALDGEIVITVIATGFGAPAPTTLGSFDRTHERTHERTLSRPSSGFADRGLHGGGFGNAPTPASQHAVEPDSAVLTLSGEPAPEASTEELKRPSSWRTQSNTVRRPTRFGGDHDNFDVPAFLRKQQG
ncbi:MAG: cell division protein FtsZ, partial [Candidatus Eisenbacteria bacterium]